MTYLADHVSFLKGLLADGTLVASGPLQGTDVVTGFLIIDALDEHNVRAIVARDPFAVNGIIDALEVVQWDPVFGAFHDRSSKFLSGFGEV